LSQDTAASSIFDVNGHFYQSIQMNYSLSDLLIGLYCVCVRPLICLSEFVWPITYIEQSCSYLARMLTSIRWSGSQLKGPPQLGVKGHVRVGLTCCQQASSNEFLQFDGIADHLCNLDMTGTLSDIKVLVKHCKKKFLS
jgi:hypothetical protein